MLQSHYFKQFILVGIFALLLVLTATFINVPLFFNVRETNQIIKNKLAESEQQSTNVKEKTNYETLLQKFPDWEKLFPASGEELELIIELENLAKSSNVTQKLSLTPRKNNDKSFLATLDLTSELEGSFTDIYNYLEKLQSLKPRLIIKSVDFDSNGEKIKAKLTAETYWRK